MARLRLVGCKAAAVRVRLDVPGDKIRLTKVALHYDRDLLYRPSVHKVEDTSRTSNPFTHTITKRPCTAGHPCQQTKMASTEGPAGPEPTAPQVVLYCQGDPPPGPPRFEPISHSPQYARSRLSTASSARASRAAKSGCRRRTRRCTTGSTRRVRAGSLRSPRVGRC